MYPDIVKATNLYPGFRRKKRVNCHLLKELPERSYLQQKKIRKEVHTVKRNYFEKEKKPRLSNWKNFHLMTLMDFPTHYQQKYQNRKLHQPYKYTSRSTYFDITRKNYAVTIRYFLSILVEMDQPRKIPILSIWVRNR